MTHTHREPLFIGPDRVPGDRGPSEGCLRVRRGTSEHWELFYDDIVGFTHETGVEYEVIVEVSAAIDPPADGSALRYELVEMVDRSPAR